jgi:quercetin dioxygenase-like cupin family protein
MLAAGLTSLVGASLYAGHVSATPQTPGGVQTTILAKSTLADLHLVAHGPLPGPGTGGTGLAPAWRLWLTTHGMTDAYVVDNKFAVGADTGWHSHPGPSIVFVVAGTMTNYSSDTPGCAPHVYPTGSSFVDPGGDDSHLLRNDGSVPAETIAFQMIPQDATRRIDEPVPAACS